MLPTDNTQNLYRVSPDGSLRVTFASGMEITLNTEPHILAGVANPTLGKCNISLPGEHNSNLIEWRQRKEQTKGNISAFERRLRVRGSSQFAMTVKTEAGSMGEALVWGIKMKVLRPSGTQSLGTAGL